MCFSFMPVERESVQYSEKETERKKTELEKKKKTAVHLLHVFSSCLWLILQIQTLQLFLPVYTGAEM